MRRDAGTFRDIAIMPRCPLVEDTVKIAVMGHRGVRLLFLAACWRFPAASTVMLVARSGHVDAIRRQGHLAAQRGAAQRIASRSATVEPAECAGAELVLFCVKSTDTVEAGRQMLPFLAPDTTIWSLQNGVDNAERLAAAIGEPVTPAVVYVATEMAGPGHVTITAAAS